MKGPGPYSQSNHRDKHEQDTFLVKSAPLLQVRNVSYSLFLEKELFSNENLTFFFPLYSTYIAENSCSSQGKDHSYYIDGQSKTQANTFSPSVSAISHLLLFTVSTKNRSLCFERCTDCVCFPALLLNFEVLGNFGRYISNLLFHWAMQVL